MKNKEWTECIYCGAYGLHYWHHVFFGDKFARKRSEKYKAIEYPCEMCHKGSTDSIHLQKSQEKNYELKRKHQKRIMEEHEMTTETWITIFGRSWL